MEFENYIVFRDAVALKAIVPKDFKDFYHTSSQGTGKSLRIRIAATHSGKVTRNNGFYLPHKMKKGMASFTAQYPKPILAHHDEEQSAIGRVVTANYVDLAHQLGGRWSAQGVQDSARPISTTLLDAFVQGTLSDREVEDIASSYFIKDSTIVDDPDYEGLGYIELIADITDPDAIQKVLDRRFLTGSTSATTNKAVCSTCKTDWAGEKGPCEHKPGKIYDDAKCVLIAGDLSYNEYSFVNRPADRHSSVIEVNVGGIQDFVTIEHDEQETKDSHVPEIRFVTNDNTEEASQEEQNMTFKDAFDLASNKEEFKDVKGLEDAVKGIVDANPALTESQLYELLGDFIASVGERSSDDDAKDEADKDESSDGTDPVKLFWGDEYEELVGDDEYGAHYLDMLYAFVEGASEEEKETAEQTIRDAKLSAAQRKKLAGSTFCGPERSFPVNDCAHFTAALRLLGRYKGPGDKSEIRACIQRKGKRLGCGGSSQDSASSDMGEFIPDYFDHLDDAQLSQMFAGLRATFTERDMEAPCTSTDSKFQDQVKELEEQLDSLQSSDQKVVDLQERLDVSRKENRYLHDDITALQSQLADTHQLVRDEKVHRVVLLSELAQPDVDITDSLKESSTEELDSKLQTLTDMVDTKEIAGKLNSGLSKEPQGKVDDPTVKVDNVTAEPKKVNREVLEQVRDQYFALRLMPNGQARANHFIAQCKAQGIIPHTFPENLGDNS
jgi:hypothetical protein